VTVDDKQEVGGAGPKTGTLNASTFQFSQHDVDVGQTRSRLGRDLRVPTDETRICPCVCVCVTDQEVDLNVEIQLQYLQR
jgi:hypothetical protein